MAGPIRSRGVAAGKSKASLVSNGQGDKRAVTYRLSQGLIEAMQANVVADGFGLKGKSKWIAEAVEGFLSDRSWRSQAEDSDMSIGNDAKDVAYLPVSLKERVDDELKGDTDITVASVIRAAIVWQIYGLKMPVITIAPEFDFK